MLSLRSLSYTFGLVLAASITVTCVPEELPPCFNGVLDGDETAIDCGGSCLKCDLGRTCNQRADCMSDSCRLRVGVGAICVPGPSCYDAVRSGGESGVDCGGGVCERCPEGETCNATTDCRSGFCLVGLDEVGRCGSPPTCTDGIRSGFESGVDCGGDTDCPRCEVGETCNFVSDCVSETCRPGADDVNRCFDDKTCPDGLHNGDESDIDCGGPNECQRCTTGQLCASGADCEMGWCAPDGIGAKRCTEEPRCDDGVRNGGETGTDCGGRSGCGPCPLGETCSGGHDCASGMCRKSGPGLGLCVEAICDDGLQNGEETEVDCGGSFCQPCHTGRRCLLPRDCKDGPNGVAACRNNICALDCNEDFDDCNSEVPGCETDLMRDRVHCGQCDFGCDSGCGNGECAIPIDVSVAETSSTCVLFSDAEVRCVGFNGAGQAGRPGGGGLGTVFTAWGSFSLPTAHALGNGDYGQATHCAIVEGGHVRCWGANTAGQLGDGSTTHTHVPTWVRTSTNPEVRLAGVVQVSVGSFFACARTVEGRVWCWGQGQSGQLGDGLATSSALAREVPGLELVEYVAAGEQSACAIVRGGKVLCWGNGTHSIGLGSDHTFVSKVPVPTSPVPGQAVELSLAIGSACARLASGQVACWGTNSQGGWGVSVWVVQSSMVPYLLQNVSDAIDIEMTGSGLCYLRSDGVVRCSGYLGDGVLGRGTFGYTMHMPFGDVVGLPPAKRIFSAQAQMCAMTEDDRLWCWGWNRTMYNMFGWPDMPEYELAPRPLTF